MADKSKAHKKDNDKGKEEPSSFFQRKRVDMLLGELLNKFPLPLPPQQQQPQPMTNAAQVANSLHQPQNNVSKTESNQDASSSNNAGESLTSGVEIKQEFFETSPPASSIGNGGTQQHENHELLSGSVKLEPNHMKPPPEKKMKM